jgi:sugar phosphate isomerase/epimerase
MSGPAISLQLYSLNHQLTADLTGSLDRLRDLGLTTLEAYDFVGRAEELASALSARGLSAPTGHAPLVAAAATDANPQNGNLTSAVSLEDVFAAARELAMSTVFEPYVAPEQWQSEGDVAETADRLNRAAVVAARYGIRVGYHNHDHELTSRIDGRHALESFAAMLDDAVVLEVDTYWAAYAGADVPALLDRLGDRVVALHIKDGPLGDDRFEQVPAGQGAIDIPAILEAAPAAEFAVIEFDRVDGDIFDAVEQSLHYLQGRGLT